MLITINSTYGLFWLQVIEGQEIVHKIEQEKTDSQDRPVKPVVITASGALDTPTPFVISDDPYE